MRSAIQVVLLGLASCGLLLAAPAVSQEVSPFNVNDCTLLKNPTALRDCIDRYEGQRLGPGPRILNDGPPPPVRPALVGAAGPIPGAQRTRWRRGREIRRPPEIGNPVRIQQVR